MCGNKANNRDVKENKNVLNMVNYFAPMTVDIDIAIMWLEELSEKLFITKTSTVGC